MDYCTKKTIMMKAFIVWLCLFAIGDAGTIKETNEEIVLDAAESMSRNIEDVLATTLGYDNFQKHYDSLSFTSNTKDGDVVLHKLANRFGGVFMDRNTRLLKLKDVVEQSISDTTTMLECCKMNVSELTMDDRFKQPVEMSSSCYQKSISTKRMSGSLKPGKFEEVAEKNIRDSPSLKWQYFGSETGIMTTYPKAMKKDCDSYDPRVRPWYVKANVPEPKDVVILIDKSNSMGSLYSGKTLLDIAKEASQIVVNTLNPRDRVAVIGFSDNLSLMGNEPDESCFENQLAVATHENTHEINEFIDEISLGGSTMYGMALSKAFDYFENTESLAGRERVIILFSDGIPTDKSAQMTESYQALEDNDKTNEYILNILKERNGKLDKMAMVMTYGLGNLKKSILEDMANGKGDLYDFEKSETTEPGEYTYVENPSNLRQEMVSYYNHFAKNTPVVEEPIWSHVYLDVFGLGLVMTGTLPINDKEGNILGVVGVDMTINDLIYGSFFFRPSDLSYVFIIDPQGYVLYHPLFVYPDDNEVKQTDILAFETDSNMIDVIASMKSGETGSKAFKSHRVVPAGGDRLHGMKTVSVTTNAHWKKIPNSDFRLCVILSVENQESTLQTVEPKEGETFLHHRLDVVKPKTPCQCFCDNPCAKNESVVFLGPRAFVVLDHHLERKETSELINSIDEYMMTGEGYNPFRPGIRDDVWATRPAEKYWQANSDTEYERYTFWKYIATSSGIVRFFPGAVFPKDFDAIDRPWYRNAIAHEGKSTITRPYKDAIAKEFLFTISKAIYGGEQKDEVNSVMGIDLRVEFIGMLMKKNFPGWFSSGLTLIDSTGFVLFGEKLDLESALPTHITQTEPSISDSLIANNIMTQTECVIVEETAIQHTYKIQGTKFFRGKTTGGCIFEFVPIPRTNLYAIHRQGPCWPTSTSCVCSSVDSTNRKCISGGPGRCECPCTTPFEQYNTCTNKYDFTGVNSVACTPPPRTFMSVSSSDSTGLPQCSKYIIVGEEGDDEYKNPDEKSGISTEAVAAGGSAAVVLALLLAAIRMRM
ncbi:VWFA and cache domain-containing protein 1-like [Styela clava]